MFSNEDFKNIIDLKSVGTFFPYLNGTEKDIENYIKFIIADLNRSCRIKVEVNTFGSGYASFFDLFCYKKDGSSTMQKGGVEYIDGILVYICRLAPVAVWGYEQITKNASGGGVRGFLCPANHNLEKMPNDEWTEFINELKVKLGKHNIYFLDKEYVLELLPFETKIPTILDDGGPYRIFDALFFWED